MKDLAEPRLSKEERLSLKLWEKLQRYYPEWVDEMNNSDQMGGLAWADVDPSCLGFVHLYEALSHIIPKNRVIYDFGCAYAPQAWYFRNHRKYVGIQPGVVPVVHTPNSEYHWVKSQEFLKSYEEDNNTFAIVSYVPDDEVAVLVKAAFKDVFTFYVAGDDLKGI